MPIYFEPLGKGDYSIVRNLESETEITGKVKYYGKIIDKKFRKDYKKGIRKAYITPIIANDAVTSSVYSNERIHTTNLPSFSLPLGSNDIKSNKPSSANLFSHVKTDPAIDFAFYDMVEKYPDIDYFTDVRFDRKFVKKGKRYSETVKVRANGINLRTD
jgi:hypothetical protein